MVCLTQQGKVTEFIFPTDLKKSVRWEKAKETI